MEVSVKSIYSAFESFDHGAIKPWVKQIMGDDYDLIPVEILDEDDLKLLSPTNFHQAVTA
jgi:hypothetical protein